MASDQSATLAAAVSDHTPCGYARPAFDSSVPNVARVYDCLLGGKDNFAADRAFAATLQRIVPDVATAAAANRAFLGRAVRHLAGRGITQFIDIGCGLPTVQNTHEVAQAACPAAHVTYVDYDPVVLSHAHALLANSRDVSVVRGDLRDPEDVLSDAELKSGIDLVQPVVVLLVAVLHFISDADDPLRILTAIKDTVAPGSYIVISHSTAHGFDTGLAAEVAGMYQDSSAAAYSRSPEAIRDLFAGLELVPPGVIDVAAWPSPLTEHTMARTMFLGGFGRVP